MRIMKAFWMSMGMFSTFPVPKKSWQDACMPLVVPLFPLVGAVIGLAWYAVARLLLWAGAPLVITTALAGLSPFFFSGCLHLDGWMDTADAVLSRRDLEERRRILKDSHVGAFAVIAVQFLFVLHFAAFYALLDAGKALSGLVFLCAVSRAATGIALLNRAPIAPTGYLATFQQGTRPAHTRWLVCVLVFALLAGGLLHWKIAVSCAVALAAAFGAERYLFRRMQGFSGDLCGCMLTAAELCGLLCLAVL